MKARCQTSAVPKGLRSQAEHLVARTPRELAQMPMDDVQKLVHELQVHQIELEMQNEQLLQIQLELEQARDRYADLYNFAPTAYLTLNADSEILEANLAASRLLGWELKQLIHQKFTRFLAAEAQDTFYLLRRQALSSDTRQSVELVIVIATSHRRVVQLDAACTPTGPRKQFRISLVDVTERKQAEEALRESEATLRRSEHNLTSFYNQAPMGLEWLSASGSIVRANQAQLELVGYPRDEYEGQFFGKFCADSADAHKLLDQLTANQPVRNLRLPCRRRDGTVRQVLVDAKPIWHEGRFLYSSVFSRDITERVNLERRILEISEREQRRIGRDLHDGLGQILVGTAFLGSTLRQKLAARRAPEVRQLDRLLHALNAAIQQTRTLAHGLHPVKPEPNGLMAALRALAAQTTTWFQVPCRFICRNPVLVVDNTASTHLYRIAQEAVTNAIKHGKPGHIQISLTRTPTRLNLMIKDNGVGLPAKLRKKPGVGLHIMRYRAGVISGSLTIQKEPSGGTAVICSVHDSGGILTPPPRKATVNSH